MEGPRERADKTGGKTLKDAPPKGSDDKLSSAMLGSGNKVLNVLNVDGKKKLLVGGSIFTVLQRQ